MREMNPEYIQHHDIVRRYLREQLDAEEKAAFEAYFMDKPELIRQLELDAMLMQQLPEVLTAPAEASRPSAESIQMGAQKQGEKTQLEQEQEQDQEQDKQSKPRRLGLPVWLDWINTPLAASFATFLLCVLILPVVYNPAVVGPNKPLSDAQVSSGQASPVQIVYVDNLRSDATRTAPDTPLLALVAQEVQAQPNSQLVFALALELPATSVDVRIVDAAQGNTLIAMEAMVLTELGELTFAVPPGVLSNRHVVLQYKIAGQDDWVNSAALKVNSRH